MTLKYDEFFVTPSGTVEIRRFLPGKSGKFEQTTIGKDGLVPDRVYSQLQMADKASLHLWNAVQDLLPEFPYPAHAYVFCISKNRGSGQVNIEFQLKADLDLQQVKCWKRTGKRWGWETPRTNYDASFCVQAAFEALNVETGGGNQITYYPIRLSVSNVEDAHGQLTVAEKVFEETGVGPFLQEPKPWRDGE